MWVSDPNTKSRSKLRAGLLCASLCLAALAFGPASKALLQQGAKVLHGLHPSSIKTTSSAIKPGKPFAFTGTLLDEVGHLAEPVSADTVAAWKSELKTTHPAPARAAALHIWLGEWELTGNEAPDQANWHFRQAQHLSPRTTRLYGLAAYDRAICLYDQGAYWDAIDAFHRLLDARTALSGYSRRDCALFYKHASACAGYHLDRARAGIPEPPRLDPLCAAAGMANSLKTLGLPYSKALVLSRLHVTGIGSNLQDILAAAPKLGVVAHAVTADDKGLQALPLPAIAFVEHDHFISVVKADKQGVSYLCSDCGPWPGGRVNLTWKQWHLLNAEGYVTLSKPGSVADKALQMVVEEQQKKGQAGINLAFQGSLSQLSLSTTRQALHLFSLLKGHVMLLVASDSGWSCSGKWAAQHCASQISCPLDNGGSNPGGPKCGDPVNLATAEEEYSPAADLTVYNPTGPSVVFSRIYNSLRPPHWTDPPSMLGIGWSHNYNVAVFMTSTGGGAGPGNGVIGGNTFWLQEANGARISFTEPSTPSSTNPKVTCSVAAGTPIIIEADYDSSNGSNYFTITFANRTQIVTKDVYSVTTSSTFSYYPIYKIVDRNANYIKINYTTPTGGAFPLMTNITDAAGSALLTFNRDANNNLSSISDRYNRSIYYQVGSFPVTGDGSITSFYELTQVSQVVTTGTSNPPAHWTYGYVTLACYGANTEQGVYLNTITVPSPTGTGNSTATINYDSTTNYVTSVVDANGNSRNYTVVDANHTKVTIKDTHGAVVYSYTVGFDNNMDIISVTDGTNSTVVWSAVYSDPNDPYRPSSITNGNNETWSYTWDQYCNKKTVTTPRNTTTTWTWGYTNFALGELTKVQAGSNLGSGAKSPTTYAYYEPSGLVQSVTYPLPGTTGSTSTVSASFTYDSLGNVTQITAPGNNASTNFITNLNYTTDGTYSQNDAIGQPLTVTDNLGKINHFRYDARGNCTSAWDALGNETDATYNLDNQPLQITYPATGQTGTGRAYTLNSYQYPGGLLASVSQYDESGVLSRQVSNSYGAEGEPLSISGDAEPVIYAYDAAYRLVNLEDGNYHTTVYQYNTAGYLSEIVYPGFHNTSADTIQFPSYDNAGNPLKRIDGNNVETDYVYNDPESRPTNINYPASTSLNITLGYDAYGRPTTMSDGTGSTVWNFDDDNDLTSKQITYTGLAAKTLSYTFYPNGSRETMSTPAGSFTYNYDGDGRLTQLTNPYSQNFLWTYLDNGWLWKQQSKNASNGIVATGISTRNAWGLLTEWTNQNSAGATLSDFGGTGSNILGYDAVANLKSMQVNIPAQTSYGGLTSYTYNSQDELTQEQSARAGGYTNTFGYDGAFNPSTFRGATNTFNSDNQNTANGYDGNGNPTTYKGVSLSFDPENRLTAYGSLMTAGYTGTGLRAWKQTSAGTTYFLYDGITPVCELNSSGTVTACNTFGAVGLLARHTSTNVFYTFDPVGNVCQRVNGSGTVLGSYVFDSFGNRTSTDNSTDPYSGYGSQAGYYTDWETGLCLLGHRYYDPATGRFLTRDPMGYAGGINLYGYVGNGPLAGMDPTGHGIGSVLIGSGVGLIAGALTFNPVVGM